MSPLDGIGRAIYRALLRCYPGRFRRRFAADMLAAYDRMAATPRYDGLRGRLALWARLLRDLSKSVPREHLRGGYNAPGVLGRWPAGLLSDVRHGARNLLARPGFTATAVLILAVGLGPTAAVYSLANWLLLRPIPGVTDPEELGFVWHGIPLDNGISVRGVTYANLADVTPRLETLVALAGYQPDDVTAVFEDGSTEPLDVDFVTASWFRTLGLEPVAGRVFTTAEDDPVVGGSPVAVISHRLARARFGGAEAAVGAQLRLNRRELRVIGVLPAGFHGPERTTGVDLWLPGSSMFWVRHFGDDRHAEARDRGVRFYEFVARLAPGATWEQARAELAGLNTWLAETWPEANEGFQESRFLVYPRIGTNPIGRDRLRRTIWLIVAVAACILVLVCANVSNLLLMRSLDRRGEIAVQKALGAATGRLVRRTLVEALLLCAAGSAAAALLSKGLLRVFEGVHLSGLFQPIGGVSVDWRVAGFAGGLCVLVALLTSILPALGSARIDAARWLAESSLTNTNRGRSWRLALGVVQAAAAVPLVIGAILFGQTLRGLTHVELGFDPSGIRLFAVGPSDVGYGVQEQFVYYRQLEEELSKSPGVTGVTLASNAPVFGGGHYTRIRSEDAGEDIEPLQPLENEVDAGYFELLGIPVLDGRTFTADEVMRGSGETTDLVVLSASLAVRLFGTSQAVGRTVDFVFSLRKGRPFRVIGVVGDVHFTELTGEPEPIAYTALGVDGRPPSWMVILVQGNGAGEQVERAVMDAARRVDPLLPLVPHPRAPSLVDAVDTYLSEWRLLERLFTILSAAALLLAGIGLYGTVGRSVIARAREIGIRKALGADATRTFGWVLRKALAPVLVGTVAGCMLGFYGVRFVESRLYGVTGLDPVTWVAAVAVLGLVSLVAAAIPARRAVRLDPAGALRSER